jgi:hypothetical protein
VDKEKQNIKVVLLNTALDKSANVDGIYQAVRGGLNLNRLGIKPLFCFSYF